MADRSFLNRVNYSEVERKLLNNEATHLNTVDEKEASFNYGYEQYIMEYYLKPKTPELRKAMYNKLDSLLLIFSTNPAVMMNSAILHDTDFLRKVCTQEQVNKYIQGFNKLKSNWKITYNKLMNDEPVSDIDKACLFTLFERYSTFNKLSNNERNELSAAAHKYAYKVLKEKRIPDNLYERKFIFSEANKFTLSEHNPDKYEPQFISIANIYRSDCFEGGHYLLDSNYICMNNMVYSDPDFYNKFYQMIQSVCHETTHAIQDRDALKNPNSVRSLEMAIQRLFGMKEYETGHNYLYNEIEEDAQLNGYFEAGLFYGMADCYDIQKKLIQEKLKYHRESKFEYEFVTFHDDNGNLIDSPKEQFNVYYLKKIIKENPNFINKYPVLNNIFDKNGNAKSTEQMLTAEFKSHDIRKIYYDFILDGITSGDLNKLDMSKYNDEEKRNIISNLRNILCNEINYVQSIYNDPKSRINDPNRSKAFVSKVYNNHLKKIFTIDKILSKEISWMRKYSNEHPNYDLYGTYTTDIRKLLFNKERCERKNEMDFLKDINDGYELIFNNMDINLKMEYERYVSEHFKENELNSNITYEGNTGTLKQFIHHLMINMDRNHNLYNNSKTMLLNYDQNGNYIHPIDFVRYVMNNQPGLNNINSVDMDSSVRGSR